MAFDPIAMALGSSTRGFGLGNVTAIVDQAMNDLLQSQIDTAPYMLLGDVSFPVLAYVNNDETRKRAEFAEHKLLEGKPRLQWVGDSLDEITWRVLLHASYCDPEAELQKLEQLLASHASAPLFMGNGDYKGTFVLTSCTLTTRWTFDDGTLICLEATVDLKEYVQPPVPTTQTASQKPVAAQQSTPSGAMNPPGTVTAAATPRPTSTSITRN
ncbi:MAG TPA: phage tail protein [Trinickia sp.]